MGKSRDTSVDCRRRWFVGTALSGGLVGLCGCLDESGQNSAAPQQTTEAEALSGRIRVSGSSTVYPLTVTVGEQFSTEHPEVAVSVSPTGTGGGFDQFFCQGKSSINDASRPISASESQQCEQNGVEPMAIRVATDALTVVVNTDAEWINCVSPDQLAAMWRVDGASHWSDIDPDWPDKPIELHGPSRDSGTFDYFAEAVIGSVDDHRVDYEGTEYDNSIIEAVNQSTYAIGYLGYAYYLQNKETVKALAVNDGSGCVEPSPGAAQRGEYSPLSRPLFIYADEEELTRPELRAFVEYYIERAGTSLVSDIGYVPLTGEDVETASEKLRRATAGVERDE